MRIFKKLFLLTCGGLFCLVSAVGLVDQWEMFWHWEVTEATVVAVEVTESTSSRLGSGDLYAPHLQFTDAAGQTHQVRSPSSEYGPGVVGDIVEVIYDPSNPETAIHNGFIDVWLAPILIGVLGLCLLYMGVRSNRAERIPS